MVVALCDEVDRLRRELLNELDRGDCCGHLYANHRGEGGPCNVSKCKCRKFRDVPR